MIVGSALMIWKTLMVITNTECPVVVVLSGSMEPAYCRGDILFLSFFEAEPLHTGDVVVYKL
jgi:signal peptidase